MFQSNTNTLQTIIADEKEALLDSIVILLRQKGFVVSLQEQAPLNSQIDHGIEKLDALSILRIVQEDWPQNAPVKIFNIQSKTTQSIPSNTQTAYAPSFANLKHAV